jgi:hypothetical protein
MYQHPFGSKQQILWKFSVGIVLFFGCVLPCGAQTVSGDIPPKVLLDSWDKNIQQFRGTISSFQVEGVLITTNQSPRFGQVGASGVYRWISKRSGTKFYWDVTDGKFTWNPRDDKLENTRTALAFDDHRYSYLRRSTRDTYGKEGTIVAPEGFNSSLGWMKDRAPFHTEVSPLEKTAQGLQETPDSSKKSPSGTEKADAEEKVHEIRDAILNHPPAPLDPDVLLGDFFNDPVRGILYLPKEMQKHLSTANVTPERATNGEGIWRLDIRPFVSPDVLLPSTIWFMRRGQTYYPWRMSYRSVDKNGETEGTRVATVTEWGTTPEGTLYPKTVKTVYHFRFEGSSEPEPYITEERKLTLSRINETFADDEFRIQFPTYASYTVDDAVRSPREPVPPPALFRFLTIGLVALVGISGVAFIGVLLRGRSRTM